ncbi:MAG: signal transduction histidine kinase [Cognaticolwellia sp.]
MPPAGTSLRVAVLAACLSTLAVILGVAPLLWQLQSDALLQAQDHAVEVVALALERAEEPPGESLSGWSGLNEQGEALLSDPASEAIAARCPHPLPADRVYPAGPLHFDGAWIKGACGITPAGTPMVGWMPAPDTRSWLVQLAWVTALSAVLAGSLVFLVLRRSLAPLTPMAHFAAALGRGETPEALKPPQEPQLQILSNALNQLSSALAAREDEVAARQALTQELGAVVAHEVRNPLQSVTMLADLLAHEPELSERKMTLADLATEVTLIEQVVQRLLSADGNLRLIHAPFQLKDMLQRAVGLHQSRARAAGIQLTLTLPKLPVQVRGDAALLRRAVENLIQNAIAVLDEKGGSQVHLGLVAEGDQLWIAVEDDGPGVPTALREQIFGAGFSARRGGSGLGLSVAKRVVHGHGGQLEIDDSPLGGARFLITLPGAPQ